MGSRDARSVGGDEFTHNSRHALSVHRWAPGPTPCANVSPTSGLSVELIRHGEFGLMASPERYLMAFAAPSLVALASAIWIVGRRAGAVSLSIRC